MHTNLYTFAPLSLFFQIYNKLSYYNYSMQNIMQQSVVKANVAKWLQLVEDTPEMKCHIPFNLMHKRKTGNPRMMMTVHKFAVNFQKSKC